MTITEEELKALLQDYGLAWYEGGEMDQDDFKAAILAAFAELRQERNAALEALKDIPEWYGDDEHGWECLSCHVLYPPNWLGEVNHAPNCQRQRALGVKP